MHIHLWYIIYKYKTAYYTELILKISISEEMLHRIEQRTSFISARSLMACSYDGGSSLS